MNSPSNGMMEQRASWPWRNCAAPVLAPGAKARWTSWATFTGDRKSRSVQSHINYCASPMLVVTRCNRTGRTAIARDFTPSTTSDASRTKHRKSQSRPSFHRSALQRATLHQGSLIPLNKVRHFLQLMEHTGQPWVKSQLCQRAAESASRLERNDQPIEAVRIRVWIEEHLGTIVGLREHIGKPLPKGRLQPVGVLHSVSAV